MGAANRKVVLFVDNCPAYTELNNLRNIELVYLPTNTTSMLQPLDHRIIKQVKLKFWEMLVRRQWKQSSPVGGQCSKKLFANCFCHTHFVTPVDEGAAVHVFLAAAGSEDPDEPPPVDAEPQPGPSTVPLSAHLTVTWLCDEKTWQQLAPECTFEEFVTTHNDIAVWGTLNYADDVHRQQELSGEDGECEVEEPAQVPTVRDILKAGDVNVAVLRRHGAND
ncbi:hypothetical protein PR048_022139 [Dryococelus australis]|uniref:DDE-1 domain-containing protein n=1 Tax=Dryococelus australis TaxID=614101 RepID=A0ABQ9H074_9NEOP|nr:hypothetical protein PR048_022139 [Dryococelus australis]